MAGSGEAKRSVHHRIADDLRAAIRAGEYHDGDRLPGENEIMKRYSVARVTAREALAVLRNEGLAVSRRAPGCTSGCSPPSGDTAPGGCHGSDGALDAMCGQRRCRSVDPRSIRSL